MKRLLTILFLLVLLSGVAVLSYSFVPGFSKVPYLGPGIKELKRKSAIMVLFKKKFGLEERKAYCRFYVNGKWQPMHDFQAELFKEYSTNFDHGALQHCRLDSHLVWGIYAQAGKHSEAQIKKSRNYLAIKRHLIFAHSGQIEADSLQILIYESANHIDRKLVLNIKDSI